MVTKAGVLLFRQKETAESAEYILAAAREAITEGRLSTDCAEMSAAIEILKKKSDKNAYYKHQLASIEKGHIVGIILEATAEDNVAQMQCENAAKG